ncbi:hypothetical protein C9374_010453 [Naegleria lovaniensis]|uniref:Uncharacterized protein n=1 Tax=Naegleria lovaniensis TaxID=51637 RepID=A0AA88GG77_NAELO|nr:uncharacterized protein C9374_010453 [Naegleria lovaniensis]KAG2374709.1 hypothetical protein C9374_010453 [Naegleria lovaniensis]
MPSPTSSAPSTPSTSSNSLFSSFYSKPFWMGSLFGASVLSLGFLIGCFYQSKRNKKDILELKTLMQALQKNQQEPILNQKRISSNLSECVVGNPGDEMALAVEDPNRQPSPGQLNTYQRLYHKPKRIFLIRHGESEGNIDPNVYAVKPDNKIELTELGMQQADEAGKKLKQIIGDESVCFFISPYKRSVQTFEMIAKHFGGKENVYYKEDPRLREQDFGNFQDPADIKIRQEERRRFGSFYYRFPQGESGSDVFCRVSSFCGSMLRSMEEHRQPFDNYVLISHGLTCRLFLMRYYHWSVDTFHALWNLSNCQVVTMELQENGKYKIREKLKIDDENLLPTSDFAEVKESAK